jgi:hypothetical protein
VGPAETGVREFVPRIEEFHPQGTVPSPGRLPDPLGSLLMLRVGRGQGGIGYMMNQWMLRTMFGRSMRWDRPDLAERGPTPFLDWIHG